jgi:hypothetical protein
MPKIRAPPLAPLDGRTPAKMLRFHVMVHAHDGNSTEGRQVAGQVKAVDMDEIERLRFQMVGQAAAKGA